MSGSAEDRQVDLNSGADGAEVAELIGAIEPRLRRALVARFGVEQGVEAAADAMAWAWEHRDQVAAMDNPAGYLYRVGQSSQRCMWRRLRRTAPDFPAEAATPEAPHRLDDDVFVALRRLSRDQRTAVVLVHAYGFSYREVAELMNVSEAGVTNHVHRGLRRLREQLRTPR